MDDLEFIRKCSNGDKQSWDEFVDRYSRLIYNYIYAVLRTKGVAPAQDDDINDIFQEIFLLLVKDDFRKLKSFKAKNGCSFASWLRQLVVNFTIDCLRKQKPSIFLDDENEEELSLKNILPDTSEPVLSRIMKEEQSRNLKDCFKRLETEDKYFLELHINKGIPLEELKSHLKLSRGAIDMRKTRIVDKLRECFRNKGFGLL